MYAQQLKHGFETFVGFLIRSRLLGIGVLGLFIAVATVIMITGPTSEPQSRSEKAWPVSVKRAEPNSLSPTLIAYGRVESRQLANLKTSITALVDKMLVSEGDWVEQGDVLIELRADEMTLALEIALAELSSRSAQLETARTEYELAQNVTGHHEQLKQIADAKLQRHLDLYASKMVSNALVDEVRREKSERSIALQRHYADLKVLPRVIQQRAAAVAEARALVDRAKIDLSQTELLAPFSGRVIDTLVAPGDRSLPGMPLLQIANYERLEVRASIPAEHGYKVRQRLEQGERVTALGQLDNNIIELELDRLSGNVKAGQSGIDAFFVSAADEKLDIGRVVNLQITLPKEADVIAIPVQSLYDRGRIYRVVNNRLEGIDVERVGDFVDDEENYRVLVRSGEIKPGDQLITTQLPRAITGLLVEPIDSAVFEQVLVAKIPVSNET